MRRKILIVIGLMIVMVSIGVASAFYATHKVTSDAEEYREYKQEIYFEEERIDKDMDITVGDSLAEREAAYKEIATQQFGADSEFFYPEGFKGYSEEELEEINGTDIYENYYEEDAVYDDEEDGYKPINITIPGSMTYAEYMSKLAYEYDCGIPFYPHGYSYTERYATYENSQECGLWGIGNVEYIQALYLQTFGYIPELICEGMENSLKQISMNDVCVGDIAVCNYADGSKDYAICMGNIDGYNVYSICNALGTRDFPDGCVKSVFDENETNLTLKGFPPICFSGYYASPVTKWSNEED